MVSPDFIQELYPFMRKQGPGLERVKSVGRHIRTVPKNWVWPNCALHNTVYNTVHYAGLDWDCQFKGFITRSGFRTQD